MRLVVRGQAVLGHHLREEQRIERARNLKSSERKAAIAMKRGEGVQHGGHSRAFRAKHRAINIKENEVSCGHAILTRRSCVVTVSLSRGHGMGRAARIDCRNCRDNPLRCIGEICRGLHRRNLALRIGENLPRRSDVRSLKTHH